MGYPPPYQHRAGSSRAHHSQMIVYQIQSSCYSNRTDGNGGLTCCTSLLVIMPLLPAMLSSSLQHSALAVDDMPFVILHTHTLFI